MSLLLFFNRSGRRKPFSTGSAETNFGVRGRETRDRRRSVATTSQRSRGKVN